MYPSPESAWEVIDLERGHTYVSRWSIEGQIQFFQIFSPLLEGSTNASGSMKLMLLFHRERVMCSLLSWNVPADMEVRLFSDRVRDLR